MTNTDLLGLDRNKSVFAMTNRYLLGLDRNKSLFAMTNTDLLGLDRNKSIFANHIRFFYKKIEKEYALVYTIINLTL
jgi:hypothetical protein